MLGSEHNDEFYMEGGHVRTRTNRSGGVQGGISNGAVCCLCCTPECLRHAARRDTLCLQFCHILGCALPGTRCKGTSSCPEC